jgi:hypothetical protein
MCLPVAIVRGPASTARSRFRRRAGARGDAHVAVEMDEEEASRAVRTGTPATLLLIVQTSTVGPDTRFAGRKQK